MGCSKGQFSTQKSVTFGAHWPMRNPSVDSRGKFLKPMYLLFAGYSMTSRLPPSGTLIWLRLVPSAYISRIFWQALRSRVPCKVAMFDNRTFCRLPQSARVSPVMVMMTFSVLLPRMSSVRRRPRTTMVPLTFFRCQSPMESSQLAAWMAFCWSAEPPRSMVIRHTSPALVLAPCTMLVPFAMAGYMSNAGVIS